MFDPATGTYTQRELPGPPSIIEWRRCYKVWRYAMLVLHAASAPVLDRYADKVERVYRDWGHMGGEDLWWITLLADIRMRSEGFERIRRQLEIQRAELKKHGRVSEAALDPARPWEAVIYHASREDSWWTAEVQQAGILYKTALRGKGLMLDEGHHVGLGRNSTALSLGSAAPAGSEGRGKRKGGACRKRDRKKSKGNTQTEQAPPPPPATGDTRSKEDQKGGGKKGVGTGKVPLNKQLCFAWARDAAGCPDPCPNGRDHPVCRQCGKKHPWVAPCPA